MRTITGYVGLFALVLAACGGGPEAKTPEKAKAGDTEANAGSNAGGEPVKAEAADAFAAAVTEFKKHEDARDWDDSQCNAVSAQFLAAGKAQGGKFPAAHYNAGVVLLRCGREDQASAEFDTALTEARELAASSSDPKVKNDPEFHQVYVQKALILYRKGEVQGITDAIEMIRSKGFDPDGSRNVEAFVNLGMLYRERWTKDRKNDAVKKKDDFGLEDDLARAQFWLQNALSINDSFMPAYNQLALYYLDKARAVGLKNAAKAKPLPRTRDEAADKKAKADRDRMKSDLQTLDLGLLVSEEASRRDPNYAGIWNTQGLILLEMNRTGGATKAFKAATEKDPKFFEAWMNYAAINLAFRGYAAATDGYQAASGIRPKDYDAKLGLAVATRGQLDFHLTTKQSMERKLSECADPDKSGTAACQEATATFAGKIKEQESKFQDFYSRAVSAYDEAEKVDVTRPEAYFDKALLIEKYQAKTGKATTVQAYREAEKLYNEFAQKFAGAPRNEKLVADAKSRAIEAGKSAKFEEDAMSAPTPASSAGAKGASPATSGSAHP
ncbi:MAG: hypothetical protein NVS3B20_05210 [Polyangiales bacterium]